jgi:hypothetical protein
MRWEMITNGELIRILKEVVKAYLNLPGETEENHKKHQS